MKRTLFLLCVLVSVFANAAAAPITTVILVRHGEKAGPSGDVPLNDLGVTRANELLRVLSGTKVAAIYVTPYLRTEQTAAPLAVATHLEPVIVKADNAYAKNVVDAILRDHKGETVVVIGHSNTTPDVIKQLGVANPPKMDDSTYDDLFVVSIAKGATPKLLSLRYGAPAR